MLCNNVLELITGEEPKMKRFKIKRTKGKRPKGQKIAMQYEHCQPVMIKLHVSAVDNGLAMETSKSLSVVVYHNCNC